MGDQVVPAPLLRRDADIVVVPLERGRFGPFEPSCSHATALLTVSTEYVAEVICATCLARWSAVPPPAASLECVVCGDPFTTKRPTCAGHELHAAALATIAHGDVQRHRRAALRYAASFLLGLAGAPGSAALEEIAKILLRFAMVE